jgi:NADP-dependent 3-hydroxy acid dehydrogenase YdfG
VSELGDVDILVNSAGITKRVSTLECSEEDWDEIMSVNLKGTLYFNPGFSGVPKRPCA